MRKVKKVKKAKKLTSQKLLFQKLLFLKDNVAHFEWITHLSANNQIVIIHICSFFFIYPDEKSLFHYWIRLLKICSCFLLHALIVFRANTTSSTLKCNPIYSLPSEDKYTCLKTLPEAFGLRYIEIKKHLIFKVMMNLTRKISIMWENLQNIWLIYVKKTINE